MNGDDKKFAEAVETMLGHAKSREAARNALAQLFPKVASALRSYIPRDSEDRNERKRRHRISEKDSAAAYFRLDPQPASWGRSEIDLVLRSEDPSEALSKIEARVSAAPEADRPRLRRLFLEALDGAFGVTRPFSLMWFQALLNIGPSYVAARDEATQFLYTFDNADRIRWIIIHALETMLPENRAALVEGVIPHARDISILCDVVRTIAGDRHVGGARDRREVAGFGDLTDSIRNELLSRVRLLAQTNQIWLQSQPDRILWFWWGSDFEVEVHNFTKKAMETEDGLRGLLDVPVSMVYSTEGNYEHIGVSSWSKIVDLDELAKRATALTSSLNDSDKRLALRFLDALERGKKRPV
jgi:hypothetical protein